VAFKTTFRQNMNNIPTKGEYMELLLRSPQTIFSTKDVALLWREDNDKVVSDRLRKYANSGKLIRVHHGLYAKDRDYNRLELATRIYTPSYISFETVLAKEGVVFQYYRNIFVASYVSREIEADSQKISFVRMKDYVLSDGAGIDHKDGIAIATKERAFLDRLYINKEYYFDNITAINWDKIFEILPIYHNKKMEKKIIELFRNYKEKELS
jgi:predicted transcriptional regulator of viral defense system